MVPCPAMTTIQRSWVGFLFACALPGGAIFCLLAGGCGPGSSAERSYLEERRARLENQEDVAAPAKRGQESMEAMKLVREHPSAEEGKTMEQWTLGRLGMEKGSALFPNWRARRSGLNKYEVRFEYTLVDKSSLIQRKGFAWEVDVSLNTVSAPRELQGGDLDAKSPVRYQGKPRLPSPPVSRKPAGEAVPSP